MAGAVQSRATDATWRYDELARRAESVTIDGSERSVTTWIPEPEVLMAMAMHTGRLTDARDVVELADNVDFERVADDVVRGNTENCVRC